jgi:enoyl-CoA hydratase/carnithine racemase
MAYEHCSVVREGRITIVTIEREASHNALHFDAHLELSSVFDAFAADDDQWVAIITGAGQKAFCAGNDLKLVPEIGPDKTPRYGFAGLTNRFDLSKPVIAAVNGVAMGGGFEIALACDIIVAHERAVFALPEPRVGLAALAGGIQRLALDIGLKRAMSLLLTGRRVSASEGLTLGFVSDVVSEDVLGAAKRWADYILECSPLSVRATKDAAHKIINQYFSTTMTEEWEYPAMRTMLASEDAAEGPRAFTAKRPPTWKGR